MQLELGVPASCRRRDARNAPGSRRASVKWMKSAALLFVLWFVARRCSGRCGALLGLFGVPASAGRAVTADRGDALAVRHERGIKRRRVRRLCAAAFDCAKVHFGNCRPLELLPPLLLAPRPARTVCARLIVRWRSYCCTSLATRTPYLSDACARCCRFEQYAELKSPLCLSRSR